MKKQLLFQSDDYGISDGVTDGIIKAIEDGIVYNTGLFVNMPSSKRAAEKIKPYSHVALGIDINLVAGNSISDKSEVTDLVDENGHFISSQTRMATNKVLGHEGYNVIFEKDPYPYDQTVLEVERQILRFRELVGKMPDYLHGHSLSTPNIQKAMKEMAKKYDLFLTSDVMKYPNITKVKCDWTPKPFPLEKQIETDVESLLLKSLNEALKGDILYYICHCGYVDAELLNETSYTIIRTKDLKAACSEKIKQFIKDNDIELITYAKLKEVISSAL